MRVRREEKKDFEAVYSVVKCAFASAEHADGKEQELVEDLRNSEAFVPELSLVAEREGEIVGHILFTKASVDGNPVLALAPVSVLPEYQRKGVGKTMIQEGHRIAQSMGYAYSVVLGDPGYYCRMGYLPAEHFGITPPKGLPGEYLMVCQLNKPEEEIRGSIVYAKEFGIES